MDQAGGTSSHKQALTHKPCCMKDIHANMEKYTQEKIKTSKYLFFNISW